MEITFHVPPLEASLRHSVFGVSLCRAPFMNRRASSILLLLLFLIPLLPPTASATQPRLATAVAYHRYIDPLLSVKDFKTHYYEDGAADATVLFPLGDADHDYPLPADPVIALVRLRER